MLSANKRKKNSRQRGSHTHGWGAKKKHRGAGHRGGRGKSGTGKKAHQRMPSVWKDHPFGRKGFVPPTSKPVRAINIEYIDEHISRWMSEKLVQKEGDKVVIDLAKFKFDKLLAGGRVKYAYKIIVSSASENAIEKIKQHGGEVITK